MAKIKQKRANFCTNCYTCTCTLFLAALVPLKNDWISRLVSAWHELYCEKSISFNIWLWSKNQVGGYLGLTLGVSLHDINTVLTNLIHRFTLLSFSPDWSCFSLRFYFWWEQNATTGNSRKSQKEAKKAHFHTCTRKLWYIGSIL